MACSKEPSRFALRLALSAMRRAMLRRFASDPVAIRLWVLAHGIEIWAGVVRAGSHGADFASALGNFAVPAFEAAQNFKSHVALKF